MTRWWTPVDGRFRCDLCPRECTLSPGQRGFCFVRQATDDGIELTTYGRSSGFCVDPIEKKPLAHFLPGTPVLSFGTAGCNLGCRFCQNWDISKARRDDRLQDTATPEAIAAEAERLGCRSVAYTYNDPVIFAEYAIDTAEACRERGVRSVAVTAGYIRPPARDAFFGAMDAANIDLKAFTDGFYEKLCFARLPEVLETIAYAVNETSCWVELTTLLIPGANDSEAEIDRMTSWIADTLGPDVPLHLTAFHPDFKLDDRGRTPLDTLLRSWRIAKANGLHHVYTGNVRHPATAATRCASCGEEVIGRDGYVVTRWNLAGGACGACGAPLAGVFEDRPGSWGSRRLPVRIPAL
ncbi:MAG: AmmeMemoRadiSam system radical SAM enzyme [Alphaproteobacteria bacterium]|nr:AmmeMemoRadiSam system radical SAM enzyme [Alphaproteobacteria bacterium]